MFAEDLKFNASMQVLHYMIQCHIHRGRSVFAEDTKFNATMKAAADYLYLKEHMVRDTLLQSAVSY